MSACLVSLAVALAAVSPPAVAASDVAKRVIRPGADGSVERLGNAGFEDVGDAAQPAAKWGFWDRGYERVRGRARTGEWCVRCTSDDPGAQLGAAQTVVLNQTEPAPVLARGWSRAESVSGSPSGGYAVYVDVDFADGDHLWAQVSPFDTGTHDWQERQVTLVPEKPVRQVTVYGLFRGHTGAVDFDDFSVSELVLAPGAGLFDGVPVEATVRRASAGDREALTAGGLELAVDRRTGRIGLAGGASGGFLLRDVAADSDFLQPTEAAVERRGEATRAELACPELDLDLSATVAPFGRA
ncbi:MAG: hypothetical protein FJX74_14680, partial [Armatimonadetes bacterium]|nr:hypothetical protein [Armatimonadota bacterium]